MQDCIWHQNRPQKRSAQKRDRAHGQSTSLLLSTVQSQQRARSEPRCGSRELTSGWRPGAATFGARREAENVLPLDSSYPRQGPDYKKKESFTMEGLENIPLPKLPGTEFYSPLDLARPRPQVFKVVNGIAGNYGEVRSQGKSLEDKGLPPPTHRDLLVAESSGTDPPSSLCSTRSPRI